MNTDDVVSCVWLMLLLLLLCVVAAAAVVSARNSCSLLLIGCLVLAVGTAGGNAHSLVFLTFLPRR